MMAKNIPDIDIRDLDGCLEVYDRLYAAYAKRKDTDSDTLFFLFLLRHGIISKAQASMLLCGNVTALNKRLSRLVNDKGLLIRLGDNKFVAYALTAEGRRYSIKLFAETFASLSASDTSLLPPFSVSCELNKISLSFEEVAAVVDKFTRPVKSELHHNSASRDFYIYLSKHGVPFVYQSECNFSAGELLSVRGKKEMGSRALSKSGIRSDASLSLLLSTPYEDRVIIEQDTGSMRIGVLKKKLENYEGGVFAYKRTYPGIIDYTLCISISYPASVTTTKYAPADAECVRNVKRIASAIEAYNGMEPHTLSLSDLSKALEAADEPLLANVKSFVGDALGRAGGVSVQAYNIESLMEPAAETKKVRSADGRRANIRTMLLSEDMSFLNLSYERGLSLCVLSNSFPEEIGTVRTELGPVGADVIKWHLAKLDVDYDYEPYHEYEITAADGVRKVVFRNCYHVKGYGDICVENVDVDLGAMYRAGLYMAGECKDMKLICIATAHEAPLCEMRLRQSGSGAYILPYDGKKLTPLERPHLIRQY